MSDTYAGFDIHPAANEFPMMDSGRYQELKADISENGQKVEVVLCDGKILDGRNRAKACEELGVSVKTKEYEGDPWSFVWSLNGQRRDLIDEQRYLIWKHCHEQSEGWQAERKRITNEANEKRSKAAKGMPYAPKGGKRKDEKVVQQSVGEPSHTSKSSKSKASAAKVNPGAVARGDKLVKIRPDLAEKVRKGELKPAEAHRQLKRDSVADRVSELPKDKYRVIYADPPWSYNDKQSGSISDSYGAAEKHYPSMSMSDLSAMAVEDMSAEDAVLFLWATSPLLPDGLKLASDWGFKYKASFVWDKVKHNMGHYNSVRHEFLLVCTKGSCVPDNVKLFDSVQSIERSDTHSQKPNEFRDIIDTLYPHGKRIELFARSSAEGWDRWGNEA
jgi:N6-adenosine-specific RNA methylase IME4